MSPRKHVCVDDDSKNLRGTPKTKLNKNSDGNSSSPPPDDASNRVKKSKKSKHTETGVLATKKSSSTSSSKDKSPSTPPSRISRKRRLAEPSERSPRKKSKIQCTPSESSRTPEEQSLQASFSKLPQLLASCASSLSRHSDHLTTRSSLTPKPPPKTLRFSNVVQVIIVEEEGVVEKTSLLTQDLKSDET